MYQSFLSFQVLSSRNQIAVTVTSMMSGLQFIWPQSTVLSSGFEATIESYHKLQPKPKTVPEFEDVIQMISSALPEKAIDNAVKNFRKRLQAHYIVSANGGHIEI